MLSDEDLIERIKLHYTMADDLTMEWREEAAKLYDMAAGHQWEEIDKLRMDEELRPAVTFNLSAKYLEAVYGLQISNRQEIKYYPQQVPQDSGQADLLNGAVKWSREKCDAEIEESDAFLDCIITGVGCAEHFISTDEDPEGMYMTERRDPLEMYVDPMSRKRNYLDARWMMRVRMLTEEQFEEIFPGKLDQLESVSMGMRVTNSRGGADIHIATEAWKYENNAMGMDQVTMIPVFEYQWYEQKKHVKVDTPHGNREMTAGKWGKLKQFLENQGVPYRVNRFKRRVYYRAFVAGGIVLRKRESPSQTGFTYKFITGKRDRNKNTYSGIGRALKDPQMWVNKFFSDILYIIQTNAKGGMLAEEDAFADPARAEEEWSKPNSITMVEEGAIQDNKIMPKPAAQYPQGMDRLMEFAMNAMPETTGINLEIMGMANKVQPGIVEQHRKQSAMTILAWAFDSMRQYYHQSGKIAAEYVRKYMADGRLVRLRGEGEARYLPLVREALNFDFDIIVDEAPHSTNQQERVFMIMMEMLPIMQAQGMPIPPEFWEYSPLPNEMKQKMLQRMQPDPQEQAKQQQIQDANIQLELTDKQKDIEKKESEIEKNKSTVLVNQAKAQETLDEGSIKSRMQQIEAAHKITEIDKNRQEAEAQRIENEYFKRGRPLPSAQPASNDG